MNYTFAHFIVGSANQFAHAAALAVANLPSQAYNPLFLYGETGLGKTHLLQAIGHHITQNDSTQRVVYLQAERFVSDLVSAIQRAQTTAFRQRYRNVDVLLIDDVHVLAGKKRAQEEFLHTFNTLHEANKQIVMSSDRTPLDITPLDERLRSRFAAGLIADIQPPDLETRLAILTRKAEAQGVSLPHDVAMLVASNIRGHIGALEEGLARLIAFASLTARPLSVELAETVLQQTLAERERTITAPRIQQAVARHFGIKVSEMKSKGRQRAVTFPRQVAMFLCRELTDASFPQIGQAFGGKDHTTVLHSCEKIARLEEADEHVARLLWQLRRVLEK
jgi:chromosomal replication initiator protein